MFRKNESLQKSLECNSANTKAEEQRIEALGLFSFDCPREKVRMTSP